MAKFIIKKCKCGTTYKRFKYLDWFGGFFNPRKINGCGKCRGRRK